MATRVRRKAAAVPAIVDLASDTDDDDNANSKRRRRDSDDVEFVADTKEERKKRTRETVKSDATAEKRKKTEKANDEPRKKPSTKRTTKAASVLEKENILNPFATNRASEQVGNKSKSSGERPVAASGKSNAVEKVVGAGNSCFRSLKRKQTWEVPELLAELEDIDDTSSRNIVSLFEDDNTIPFICRYRRDMIPPNLQPERLRDIKNTYVALLSLKKRAETVVKTLEKDGVLTKEIENEILAARTMDELEFLYAPYKPANKGSLADRAKALGLEKYADDILYGKSSQVNLFSLVNKSNPDLDTLDKVADGICHIISHNISKSTEVLEELRRLQKVHRIVLKCAKAKASKAKDVEDSKRNAKVDESKYEHYFTFENAVKYVKPHQVLAINRGEKAKVLSVKIEVPDRLKNDIRYFIRKLYLFQGCGYPLRSQIFDKAFEECYSKKLQPLISRQLRTDLNEAAMKASIDVFAKNLKQLLLTSPLKGECILGIDPGFSNGCKLALISKTGDVLETGVIYPHKKFCDPIEWGVKMADMMRRHGCNLIALGNGTACRETELWITELFAEGILDETSVRYSIVSEQGASIYSCGEVAKKEFPKMDVNLISAVSISRRLMDPLSEYVKIEPKHIGVGMYQHDVNEKVLSETLNEVVSECVSFVGVDLNTASLSLLKYIAGLTASRAEKIIEYRTTKGPFKTRKDLLLVKSVGAKTFTQCAGFVRIEPLSVGGRVANLLDCTWVHPESYDIAERIIAKCGLKLENIGQPDFINRITNFRISTPLERLEAEFKVPKERILTVFEALQRVLFSDYRSDINKKPLFKRGITKMSELEKNMTVTGAVTNVTHFGAFVDIGVDKDALIHSSQMNGCILSVGDRVQATVLNVDVQRSRIQLSLDELQT